MWWCWWLPGKAAVYTKRSGVQPASLTRPLPSKRPDSGITQLRNYRIRKFWKYQVQAIHQIFQPRQWQTYKLGEFCTAARNITNCKMSRFHGSMVPKLWNFTFHTLQCQPRKCSNRGPHHNICVRCLARQLQLLVYSKLVLAFKWGLWAQLSAHQTS